MRMYCLRRPYVFFISKDLCIATGEGYDASVNVRPINHDAIVDF
jgi:hypothetical protein